MVNTNIISHSLGKYFNFKHPRTAKLLMMFHWMNIKYLTDLLLKIIDANVTKSAHFSVKMQNI